MLFTLELADMVIGLKRTDTGLVELLVQTCGEFFSDSKLDEWIFKDISWGVKYLVHRQTMGLIFQTHQGVQAHCWALIYFLWRLVSSHLTVILTITVKLLSFYTSWDPARTTAGRSILMLRCLVRLINVALHSEACRCLVRLVGRVFSSRTKLRS